MLLNKLVQGTWAVTGLYVVTDVLNKTAAVPHERHLRVGFDTLLFHGFATWYVPGLIVRNTMLMVGTATHAVAASPKVALGPVMSSVLRTWIPAGSAMVAITLLSPHVGTATNWAMDRSLRPALTLMFGK